MTWFHTDHWEPWGNGVNDTTTRRVESFLRQAKASPFASKMSLFYHPGTKYSLKDRHTTSANEDDLLEVVPRSDAEQARVESLIGELMSHTAVEFQLHVHHEHLVGSDGNWSDLHRRIKALTDPEQDERRMHFALHNDLTALRRDTGMACERWAFIHGLWALNGSDRTVCQFDNEIEILMSHGCWGDFSFPAGRFHCDPTILQQPYTCRPFTAPKGYDDPRCEPIAVDVGARSLRDGRFLVWNSKAKHDVCSFDYYSDRTFDLEKRADHIVSSWLCNCPVIDGILYIKTHAHSMAPAYYEEAHRIPLATTGSEKLFTLLQRVCDSSGVELKLATVNDVVKALREVDGRMVRESRASTTAALSDLEAVVGGAIADNELSRPSGLALLNQLAVSTLHTWLPVKPERQRAAGDYYLNRLAYSALFIDAELTIAEYCRAQFDGNARFFELGFGYGELGMLLVLSGFGVTGFECDSGRYDGAVALKRALEQSGVDLSELNLVLGVFPDVLEPAAVRATGEAVLVATNVTHSLMMEKIENVYRALTLFDHVVIDCARFGEARNEASRLALTSKLRELGFAEIERVYTTSDTDIRHFRNDGARGAKPPEPGFGRHRWSLQPPFRSDGGLGWTAHLPDELLALTDCDEAVDQSPLRLLEDGRQLGIAHVLHAEIRQKGGGRYSFWSNRLYFSTLDGSDPNTNGRKYEVERDMAEQSGR